MTLIEIIKFRPTCKFANQLGVSAHTRRTTLPTMARTQCYHERLICQEVATVDR